MTTKATPSGGKKRKLVNIHLLDGSECPVYVDVKSKYQEVFNQVTAYLSLRETEYFGLAFKKDNEFQFVVLDEKIHKFAPKNWKSGPGEGLDTQGKPLICVWFRVQFYVDQSILLREKVTRHQYYLQLKGNLLQHNHVYSDEKCFQLAAYALQADFGNFIPGKHDSEYFSPALYLPPWILERYSLDYIVRSLPALHRDLHNMTRNDAELRYIKNSSIPPDALNLHLYSMRMRKTDKACNAWLGICAKGVEVYEDDAGFKNLVATFLWKDIGKLYFDKKKFEIRTVQGAGGRRFSYYTDCDSKSKYLLSICRSSHMFQMAIQLKLMEIQHLDNEDQKRQRQSYVLMEVKERPGFHHSPSTSTNASICSTNNQRLSVVSDVSSNTTSSIVSDHRAVSFDDDDHGREVLVDGPARLPRQIKSKFKMFSSFNHSPHTPSQASPCYNLESYHTDSARALTPKLGSGNWSEARGCLPTSATSTPESYTTGLLVARSTSFHKDGLLQPRQCPLLLVPDRNISMDSAISVSGEGLSPVTPTEQQTWKVVAENVNPPETTAAPNEGILHRLQPPVYKSSPSPSLNNATSNMTAPGKTFKSPLCPSSSCDTSGQLQLLPEVRLELAQLSSPSVKPEDVPTKSHQDMNQQDFSLGVIKDNSATRLKSNMPVTDLNSTHNFQLACSNPQVETPCTKQDITTAGSLDNLSDEHQQDVVEATLSVDEANCRVPAEVQPLPAYKFQVPQSVTEHYLLALQQGSGLVGQATSDSGRQEIVFPQPQPYSAVVAMQHWNIQHPLQSQLPPQPQQPLQYQQPPPQQQQPPQYQQPPPQQQQPPQYQQPPPKQQQPPQYQQPPLLSQPPPQQQQPPQYQQPPLLSQPPSPQQQPLLYQQPPPQQPLQYQQLPPQQQQHLQYQQPPPLQSQQPLKPQQPPQYQQPQPFQSQKPPKPQQPPQYQQQPPQQPHQLQHHPLQTQPNESAHNVKSSQAKDDNNCTVKPAVVGQAKDDNNCTVKPTVVGQAKDDNNYTVKPTVVGQAKDDNNCTVKPAVVGQAKDDNNYTVKPAVVGQAKDDNNYTMKPTVVGQAKDDNNRSMIQRPFGLEVDDNKENVSTKEMRKPVIKANQLNKPPSHSVKANLHPELEQILCQTHAFSLPLITALCNDSSLMQASRSQSGSRSSYEASMVRSTDSRLTRLSHDTDPRRWSSCCQDAHMDGSVVNPSRPYSWHSEHFECEPQLALPSPDHLPSTSPTNPRSLNTKHLNTLNNQQMLLPQKMIESDPGPSSPRLGTIGNPDHWWEASPSSADLDTLSSWAGIISYSLPADSQSVWQEARAFTGHGHPQMVPHKLSSGRLVDSDSSITHKQVMAENIGIA